MAVRNLVREQAVNRNQTGTPNNPMTEDANGNAGAIKATSLSVGASGSEVEITATPAEINNTCDVSASVQTLTASGAITAGKRFVYLDNDAATIAATIADAANHSGLFYVKATSEPDVGQDHTVTLTAGTWNGTNNVATFADINDALLVFFDSDGNGTVVVNTGTVALS